MNSHDYDQILDAARCANCLRPKVTGTAFCRRCYALLPHELRIKVWRKFGEGFELAYDKSLDFLAGRISERAGA